MTRRCCAAGHVGAADGRSRPGGCWRRPPAAATDPARLVRWPPPAQHRRRRGKPGGKPPPSHHSRRPGARGATLSLCGAAGGRSRVGSGRQRLPTRAAPSGPPPPVPRPGASSSPASTCPPASLWVPGQRGSLGRGPPGQTHLQPPPLRAFAAPRSTATAGAGRALAAASSRCDGVSYSNYL